MADIAHIAGLVAAGLHPSPIPHMDFVTTTTHKTLRGPRAGMVMCRERFQKELDRAVFPTVQGGPLMHVIAAKAVCFKEALEAGFREYQQQVISNARALADALSSHGFRIVSGGTDNHLMLVDVFVRGLTGAQAEKALERAAITVNKNAIPFDTQPPMKASGIRIGTPALTTRGMKEEEMRVIAGWISEVLADPENDSVQANVRARVKELCERFPIYENRLVRSRAQHNL
jgi:glycine hydroxymethyltransferase